MLQAHKTCPCSLLLESWILLLSVPTSMLLFSSQLFSCSVNLKWLHSTLSLRCNYTTLRIIVLLPQANGNWPHLSMGDLQVSIHQKYAIAERKNVKRCVLVEKRKCPCCFSLPKSNGPPCHWAIYSYEVVQDSLLDGWVATGALWLKGFAQRLWVYIRQVLGFLFFRASSTIVCRN